MRLTEIKLVFIVFFIYLLAHGLILLNTGTYWDGWTLYGQSKETLVENFFQVGAPVTGYFHFYLLNSPLGILSYKIIIFVSYFLSILFLNNILKKITEIDINSRLFILIFFGVFPVNSARVEIINTPYAIYYLLFFTAWYFLHLYLTKKEKLIFRVLSLATFFCSFQTNSLLVFFLLPLIYIIYAENKLFLFEIRLKPAVRLLLNKYLDFICIPIIFWLVKSIYLKPYGLYEGYNELDLGFKTILNGLGGPIIAFATSFVDVFVQFILDFNILSAVLLIMGILITYYNFNKLLVEPKDRRLDKVFLCFGLLAFAVAVFPYAIVEKLPSSNDWDSRNQLLIPLGASFILFYGSKLIAGESRKRNIVILSILTAMFITININNYIRYEIDWYKQISLIENFKDNKIVKDYNTFLVNDQTNNLNAKKRRYRFYEYAGLFKHAFGNQARFAINQKEFKGPDEYKQYCIAQYNLEQYTPTQPQFLINIRSNQTFGEWNLFMLDKLVRLKLLELTDKNKFRTDLKDLIKLEIEPIKTGGFKSGFKE